MKRNASLNFFTISGLILVLGILLVNFYASRVQAQASENNVAAGIGTAFTYQGRLNDGGAPADGIYDLRFLLYNAKTGGSQIGSQVDVHDITIVEGLFTVPLDFGDVYDGTAYWVEIRVRPGSSTDTYTKLLPRQPLTPTPYALHASQADNSLGSLSCTKDQIAKFDGSNWVCTKDQSAALKADIADLDKRLDKLENADLDIRLDKLESADLDNRLGKLEYKLAHLRRSGDDLTFAGANLHVVNGTKTTDGTPNGLGNIIIGYNESRATGNDRSGSHMLVVGMEHNYSAFGGIVVGHRNTTSGNWSSVSGGYSNTASGNNSSILGGEGNTAAFLATVSGGRENVAGGSRSSVSGGWLRSAAGNYDWAAGTLWEDD